MSQSEIHGVHRSERIHGEDLERDALEVHGLAGQAK